MNENNEKVISNVNSKSKEERNVPDLRFLKFKDISWKKEFLTKYATKILTKNKNKAVTNVICNSAQLGLIPQYDFFEKNIAVLDNTESYYILNTGDFVYNPRKSNTAPYGPINEYCYKEKGIVSPLYLCFKVNGINDKFLLYRFKSTCWHKYIYLNGDSGARHDRVSIKDDIFLNQPINVPNDEEQKMIGDFIDLISNRIETQKKIIEDLQAQKKSIINQIYADTLYNCKLSEIITQVSIRNKNNDIDNVLSVSNKYGFIKQSDQFEDREVASDDVTNYKIVEKDIFAYNPARINVGSIAKYNLCEKGIISPMYICFKANGQLCPEYLNYYFLSSCFKRQMAKRLEGSVRQCLTYESLANIPFYLPSSEIQKKNATIIAAFNKKINLENNYLKFLESQKAYLLNKMFI